MKVRTIADEVRQEGDAIFALLEAIRFMARRNYEAAFVLSMAQEREPGLSGAPEAILNQALSNLRGNLRGARERLHEAFDGLFQYRMMAGAQEITDDVLCTEAMRLIDIAKGIAPSAED